MACHVTANPKTRKEDQIGSKVFLKELKVRKLLSSIPPKKPENMS
jgi:hypothetical protein